MAWFIIKCESKTWIKYLVEAENKDAALYNSDNWQYLGYVDGDETDSIIFGPFESEADVLADVASYVQSA